MKTLVIIRHAHRDKPAGREADNGLSPKGKKQARAARDLFRERFGKKPPGGVRLLSSPKLRCQETLEPIAKALKAQIELSPLLDEGAAVEARARKFLDEWQVARGPALTVISSHGDWIPIFLELATGARAELAKGAWAELEDRLGAAWLTWLVQDL